MSYYSQVGSCEVVNYYYFIADKKDKKVLQRILQNNFTKSLKRKTSNTFLSSAQNAHWGAIIMEYQVYF